MSHWIAPQRGDRTRPRRPTRRVLAVALLAVGACASAGPRTFQFATTLEPDRGRACALAVLKQHGFRFEPPTLRDTVVVAVRAPERSSRGAGEWWRAEVSAGIDLRGRTLVTSVVGASGKEDGPLRAPPVALDEVATLVTARCMWGSL